MITVFLLVSLVSVALAIGMAIALAHVLREERRRSDARVAALSQMAMDDFLPEAELVSAPASFPAEPADGLFRDPDSASSPWTARLAIAGALAVVVLVVFAIASLRSPRATHSTTTSAEVSHQAAATTTPLQLLALGYTQNGGSLTVAGRVENPPDGQPLSSLTATVFLFGQDGSFLTSGRSPLEVATLDAGGESAFAVTIPVNVAVARYRVSFRDSSGRPLSHIDRRNAAALARNDRNE
jgi:hypothetical protein